MTATQKPLYAFIIALVMLTSSMFMDTVQAVEIAPIEKINPEELQNDFDDLGSGNELSQHSSVVQSKSTEKSRPSIWAWLTNQSRKPANFHFIDIIEILD